MDNKSDVYNIMVFNRKYIKVNNLDVGIMNISTQQLDVLNDLIKKKVKHLSCNIQNNHKNIKAKKINIEIEDIKKFNNIKI